MKFGRCNLPRKWQNSPYMCACERVCMCLLRLLWLPELPCCVYCGYLLVVCMFTTVAVVTCWLCVCLLLLLWLPEFSLLCVLWLPVGYVCVYYCCLGYLLVVELSHLQLTADKNQLVLQLPTLGHLQSTQLSRLVHGCINHSSYYDERNK